MSFLASTTESGCDPGHDGDGRDEQRRWAAAWLPERVPESAIFAVRVWLGLGLGFWADVRVTDRRRGAIRERHIVGGKNSHGRWSRPVLEEREGGGRDGEGASRQASGDGAGSEEVHAVGCDRDRADIVPHRVSAAISDLACGFYLRSAGRGGGGGRGRGVAGGAAAGGGEVHRGRVGPADRGGARAVKRRIEIIELNRRRDV